MAKAGGSRLTRTGWRGLILGETDEAVHALKLITPSAELREKGMELISEKVLGPLGACSDMH
jgi:hypothetical protein